MNLEELNNIADSVKKKNDGLKKKVCVCCGAGCISSGSEAVLKNLQEAVKSKNLSNEISVVPSGCMGPCNQGPLVKVVPDQTIYQRITEEDAGIIFDKHVLQNQPVKEKILFSDVRQQAFVNTNDDPFFKKQHKIVLENCGNINPEVIEDYIAVDGYKAIEKALHLSPEAVIVEIKSSRLRGRGGAGFPTGLKWETVHKYVADEKYVICNGDEGDPGAFMDRSVLESDPHRVLEGMIIAGFAIGAQRGFAYIRGEYPLAIKRFDQAIKQARKLGLLGKNILGTEFNFDVEIRIGAGAFVCGEETALIASIEGKRGTPRPRPPYPAEAGLWGKPTLINNVETFANIAPIILRGGAWYGAIGTPKSAGTKVFALAGKINFSGLIEVPMGTSLREIIFDIGGGIPGGKKFKAAQTGGPSGGCIPEQHLDTKVDYESLVSLGSIMGSGGLIIMDETSNMVDVARYFMEFCMDESCGKCVPCRAGTKQMHELLLKFCAKKATDADMALLEELATYVKEASLCGLGASAPNPLLSTLRYFKDEYAAQINKSL
ncbi:MAG: NuoF family protein [Candidatus Omnitrophota bacterium]